MTSPAPLKPLLLIGAIVLAVHLALLSSAPVLTPLSPSPTPRPFITRTLTLPASALPHPTEVYVPVSAPEQAKARHTPKPDRPSRAATSPSIALGLTPDNLPAAPSATPSISPSTVPPNASPVAGSEETSRQAAITLPGPLRIQYDIQGETNRRRYSAHAELQWRHDGQTYDARLSVTSTVPGSRVQTSHGQLTAAGLAPQRYASKQRSEVAAHFERDQGQIIFSANSPTLALEPNAQDQLSLYIQLASLIAAEPERYPLGSSIEMQTVGARDADRWRFTVESDEALTLPGGVQATLKLKRPARHLYDTTVELWLAPTLGYLPARIRLTQTSGNFVDHQLTAFGPP